MASSLKHGGRTLDLTKISQVDKHTSSQAHKVIFHVCTIFKNYVNIHAEAKPLGIFCDSTGKFYVIGLEGN